MKKIIRSLSLVALMISALALSTKAQTADTAKHKHKFATVLTAKQQAVLKENKQKHKEAAVAFKATLTAEQKAVLADKSLRGKERKAKLAAILTLAQQEVLAANRAQAKASRNAFFATLSDKQKAEMKNLHKARRGQDGTKHHRAEKV